MSKDQCRDTALGMYLYSLQHARKAGVAEGALISQPNLLQSSTNISSLDAKEIILYSSCAGHEGLTGLSTIATELQLCMRRRQKHLCLENYKRKESTIFASILQFVCMVSPPTSALLAPADLMYLKGRASVP